MRIKKLTITNFRSIEKIEETFDSFNILIGQNNHGKTNFFEALDWFFNCNWDIEKIKPSFTTSWETEVVIEFEWFQKAIDLVLNDTKRKWLQELFPTSNTIKIRRNSSVDNWKKRELHTWKEWKNFFGSDWTWNDLLPNFQYIDTQKNLDWVSKFKKTTPLWKLLSWLMQSVLEKDSDYKDFKESFSKMLSNEDWIIKQELTKIESKITSNIQRQFPDCKRVEFNFELPQLESLFSSFSLKIDDGVFTWADEKGDGMQRSIMLSILQTIDQIEAEEKTEWQELRPFIYLIDEAELHLHPRWQRLLKEVLYDLIPNSQVFINTHSSVLIVDESDYQRNYKIEKDSNWKTGISKISDKANVIFDLLWGSPADLLFPYNFLIVEWLTEFLFLSKIIERFYSAREFIQIVIAEWDLKQQERSMNGINKVLIPLYHWSKNVPLYRDKLVILHDKPDESKKTDYENFQNSYSPLFENWQVFKLDVWLIEEYYPEKWKKTNEELKQMDEISRNTFKKNLAIKVWNEISQEAFETEMIIVFNALEKCWENAIKLK